MPQANAIARKDEYVCVQPKVMDLLVYLAAKAGEVCSRNELFHNVWQCPDVGDQALTTAISKLRRALGDDPLDPHHIRTISRRGYILVSESTGKATRDTAARSTRGQAAATKRWVSFRRLWLVAVPLALALTLGPMVMDSSHPDTRGVSGSRPYRATPLTSLPGVESEPALSPDGSRVAFVWKMPNRFASNVYVIRSDGKGRTQLTDDGGMNASPTWSPDGARIAYIRHTESGGQIAVIPALGGQPTTVARDVGSIDRIQWSNDGNSIAFAASPRMGQRSRIKILRLSTGLTSDLTSPGAGADDLNPKYSADGKLISFVRRRGGVRDDLYAVASDGSFPGRRIATFARVNGYDWLPGGRSIVCSGVLDGVDATWQIDVMESTTTWIPGFQPGIHDISMATSAPRMTYSQYRTDTNVMRMSWGEGARAEIIAGSTYSDDFPAVSRDGTQVAFVSSRSGSPQVWVADSNGANSRQLTRFADCFVGFPCWSPDMKRIAVAANPSGDMSIFVVSSADGEDRARILDGINARPVAWSRDGKSLYVATEDNDGWAIWRGGVVDDSVWTEGAVRVAEDGAFFGQESPDGVYFYFTKYGQSELWRVRAGTTAGTMEPKRILDRFHQSSRWGTWSLCKRSVISIEIVDEEVLLVRRSLGQDVAREVVAIGRGLVGTMSASEDGGTVVYSLSDHESGDLMLVEGFPR